MRVRVFVRMFAAKHTFVKRTLRASEEMRGEVMIENWSWDTNGASKDIISAADFEKALLIRSWEAGGSIESSASRSHRTTSSSNSDEEKDEVMGALSAGSTGAHFGIPNIPSPTSSSSSMAINDIGNSQGRSKSFGVSSMHSNASPLLAPKSDSKLTVRTSFRTAKRELESPPLIEKSSATRPPLVEMANGVARAGQGAKESESRYGYAMYTYDIHSYTHAHIHTYILAYIHTYIHTCMHACIHTYITA